MAGFIHPTKVELMAALDALLSLLTDPEYKVTLDLIKTHLALEDIVKLTLDDKAQMVVTVEFDERPTDSPKRMN